MGLNTVAVLLNDFCGEIENEGGELGKRMSRAMQDWSPGSQRPIDFHVGRVISRDHSSVSQIVIVKGGIGSHISGAQGLSRVALQQMADCLRRHGWSVKEPTKRVQREIKR